MYFETYPLPIIYTSGNADDDEPAIRSPVDQEEGAPIAVEAVDLQIEQSEYRPKSWLHLRFACPLPQSSDVVRPETCPLLATLLVTSSWIVCNSSPNAKLAV